jgi:hypothetical protein
MKMRNPKSFCNVMRNGELHFQDERNIGVKVKLSVWVRQGKLCSVCQQLNHIRNDCNYKNEKGELIECCGKCSRLKHIDNCSRLDKLCRLCNRNDHTTYEKMKCHVWIEDTIAKNKHYCEVLIVGGAIADDYGIFLDSSINKRSVAEMKSASDFQKKSCYGQKTFHLTNAAFKAKEKIS